jgi:hypothetical protein
MSLVPYLSYPYESLFGVCPQLFKQTPKTTINPDNDRDFREPK